MPERSFENGRDARCGSSFHALVKTVTDSLEHRLGERGATIEVQQRLPDIANDRVAVEQLFSNLLENAVKYLDPARPGEIVVRGEQRGNRAVFEVIGARQAADETWWYQLEHGVSHSPGPWIQAAHLRRSAQSMAQYRRRQKGPICAPAR